MYGKKVMIFRNNFVRACNLRFYSSDSSKRLLEFLATMPKANSFRIAEAQRQRVNIQKRSEKYSPSTVYLQVLGSGARGTSSTLYMFTDHKRYLFNCGEGTQRLAYEHKVKLSRLDHVFITSKSWKNLGGLPGLSLTLQDVGVPKITLHGPEGLDELYNATKRFVIMKDMQIATAKCSPAEDFEDNVMTVKYVLLGQQDDIFSKDLDPLPKKLKLNEDQEYNEFMNDDTDYYKREQAKGIDVQTRQVPQTMSKITKTKSNGTENKTDTLLKKTQKVLEELQKMSNYSVAYICSLKKRLGTLDLTKCVEMGVKPGPLLGKLKNGEDVVLSDGTLVLSKDVKTPDDPGPVFIVLDVLDASYLRPEEFSKHFDDGYNPAENIPALIIHFTPPHVFHNPVYQSFMDMFGPTTRHLLLNEQNTCQGSEAVHRTQHKLHLLDPDIFPMLRDTSIPAVWNSSTPKLESDDPNKLKKLTELKNKIALAQFQKIINLQSMSKDDSAHQKPDSLENINKLESISGRSLTIFHLRPKKILDRSSELKLYIQEYIQEPMSVEGFAESLEELKKVVDNTERSRESLQEYPKVVFLGTGSCIPSKTRNTSAIVIHVSENKSIMLDCGEGTFGQLVRFYGPKRIDNFLRTLQAIYVSHLHADHHIGLIGVLQERRRALEQARSHTSEAMLEPQPLLLLAPGQIMAWLSIYDKQFERIRDDFTLIPNQDLLSERISLSEMTAAVLARIGVREIETCFVSHCPNAFGVALTIDDKHKITYSGDTIPCDNLVRLGANSSLLIHEATMEDELVQEARIKMHSTTSQAIDIGRRMNARYTILTHFSQRYARIPRINSDAFDSNNRVGIAFDNMQVTMNDLDLLPYMYTPLKLMFAEHCAEMDLKAAHRIRQKERSSSPNNQTNIGSIVHEIQHRTCTEAVDNIDSQMSNVTTSDVKDQSVNSSDIPSNVCS